MFWLTIFFVPMLWKVLSKTGKPLWCSLIFIFAIWSNGLVLDLVMGSATPLQVLWWGALDSAAGTLYFYVLHELDGADGFYYCWMGLGFFGLLFLPG